MIEVSNRIEGTKKNIATISDIKIEIFKKIV